MKDVRIIAVYKAQNDELIKKYELANKHSCPIEEGQVWISTNAERPQGICSEIWKHIKKIVTSLALDEKIDIEGQMKNSNSALVSCNNGFRPVTFYIETVELENIYPTEEDYMNAIGNSISTLSSSSNPQSIGFSGILLAKRQNSFYCTYFLHNRNVADTKSPYPIKRLEVIRRFNQKDMAFNQSLS